MNRSSQEVAVDLVSTDSSCPVGRFPGLQTTVRMPDDCDNIALMVQCSWRVDEAKIHLRLEKTPLA